MISSKTDLCLSSLWGIQLAAHKSIGEAVAWQGFGYVLWYSAGRLVLEGMRDTRYILYVIPDVLGISQLVAALLIILSVAGFIYVTKSDKDCFKLQEN